MNNSTQFFLPPSILSQYINYYLFVELQGDEIGSIEQKPISNGCVEMFIAYHDSVGACYTNSGEILKTKSAIFGMHELINNVKGVAVNNLGLTFKCIIINFKPTGFYHIFKIPTSEFFNSFFESEDVIGNEMCSLRSKLDAAFTNIERSGLLSRFFINKLRLNSCKSYNVRNGFDIMNYIKQYHGLLKINQITDEFKFSERTLQRSFKSALGTTPKEFCKIMRFNTLLEYIFSTLSVDWMDVVTRLGYYDQTHLINEFKSVVGLTPEIFLKHRNVNIFKADRHLVFNEPIAQLLSIGNVLTM